MPDGKNPLDALNLSGSDKAWFDKTLGNPDAESARKVVEQVTAPTFTPAPAPFMPSHVSILDSSMPSHAPAKPVGTWGENATAAEWEKPVVPFNPAAPGPEEVGTIEPMSMDEYEDVRSADDARKMSAPWRVFTGLAHSAAASIVHPVASVSGHVRSVGALLEESGVPALVDLGHRIRGAGDVIRPSKSEEELAKSAPTTAAGKVGGFVGGTLAMVPTFAAMGLPGFVAYTVGSKENAILDAGGTGTQAIGIGVVQGAKDALILKLASMVPILKTTNAKAAVAVNGALKNVATMGTLNTTTNLVDKYTWDPNRGAFDGTLDALSTGLALGILHAPQEIRRANYRKLASEYPGGVERFMEALEAKRDALAKGEADAQNMVTLNEKGERVQSYDEMAFRRVSTTIDEALATARDYRDHLLKLGKITEAMGSGAVAKREGEATPEPTVAGGLSGKAVSPEPPAVVAPVAPQPPAKIAEERGRTAMQLSTEAAQTAKPLADIQPIKTHANVVRVTSGYGEVNKPENITTHTPETSHAVANRAVAQSLFSVMAGAVKESGVEIDDDVKATLHNITDGLSAPNGVTQIAQRWGQMGVPEPIIQALTDTATELKKQGLDINKTPLNPDTTPIPAGKAALRNMTFLNEFHKQLAARVQEMGVDAPEWARGAVAKIGKLVEPGGKYDTAFRKGLGLEVREPEAQHVPVAPQAPTGELTPGASGTEVVSNEELKRAERGDVYYRVDRSGNVTHLGPQPDAPVRKGEAVIMVGGQTGKPQVQNSEGLGTDKEVLAKFGGKVMEVANAQAGERPTGPEAPVQEGPKPSAKRVSVQAGEGEGKPVGPRADEARGERGRVLAEAGGAHAAELASLPPEVRARLEAARAATASLFERDLGVQDVRSLHDEMLDMMNVEVKPGEGEVGAPGQAVYGPAELMYPVARELPGSPYKRVLNLTSGVFFSPEMAKALGVPVRPGYPIPGSSVMAALSRDPEAWSHNKALLRSLGFDGVAFNNSADGVVVGTLADFENTSPATPTVQPGQRPPKVPSKFNKKTGAWDYTERSGPGFIELRAFKGGRLTTKRVSRNTLAAIGELWGKLPDGKFGWLQSAKPEAEVAETPKPAEAPKPVVHTPPIADKVEREQAIEDGRSFVDTHWITTDELLRLARQVGVPIGDEEGAASKMPGISTTELKQLVDRAAVESGEGVATPVKTAPVEPTKAYSPGELVHKFVAYAKDGGLGDLLFWLAKNQDFLGAIDKRTRYGRDEFRPAVKGVLTREDIKPEDRGRYFQELMGSKDLGSNDKYLMARNAINRMVLEIADGKGNARAISRSMMARELSKAHADILALTAVAAAKYQPDFFSVSEKRLADIRAREMERGAYDAPVPDRYQEPVLSGHFDVRPDSPSGFSPTLDVYNNQEAARESRAGAGFEAPSYDEYGDRLPAQPVLNKLVSAIASRGGFAPSSLEAAGVSASPRASHEASYEAAVNKIETNQKAMAEIVASGRGILLDQNRMPRGLVRNGFAALMLNHYSGNGKKPFHIDAERVDPKFEKYYTVGEQTVLQVNQHGDGLPVPGHVMTTREIGIMLDYNHPLHNQTVENVIGRLASNEDLWLSSTPMKRVSTTTADGRKFSRLVPRETLLGNYRIKTLTAGLEPQVALGQMPSGIRVSNPEVIRAAVKDALEGLRNAEPDWYQRLGDDLMDKYTMGQTILDASEAAKSGDFSKLLGLPENSPEAIAASLAFSNKEHLSKLRSWVDDLHKRLNTSKDPEAMRARALAREVDAALRKVKSDVPWTEIFPVVPENGVASTIPVAIAETAIRNKEQFLSTFDELTENDNSPNKAFARSVFEKIHDSFFEELGVHVDADPNLDGGLFDVMRRIIKMSNSLKTTASASRVAWLMTHELGHAFTAYMGIPMQQASHRWFMTERSRAMGGNRRFNDVMQSDSIDPKDGKSMISVADNFNANGSLADVVIPVDGELGSKALLASYPDLVPHMREVLDADGNVTGHKLSRNFAGSNGYRYLNHGEFIAETFKDALHEHARGIRRKGALRPNLDTGDQGRYMTRLKMSPDALASMGSLHRNMGRMIDAMVGKNTMRRFVGYLVNQGGTYSEGLRSGSTDIAFPESNWRGNDADVFKGKVQGAPPIKPKQLTPEDIAKRNHEIATNIGAFINRWFRAPLMSQLNAASVSEHSRAAADGIRSILGELGTNYNTYTSALYAFQDRAAKMSAVPTATRRVVAKLAESTPEAKKAINDGFATSVKVVDPTTKVEYLVSLDGKGKFQDVTPMSNIESWVAYEKTGKFTGELAGLEKPLKTLNDLSWSQLNWAVADLAQRIGVDPEHLADFNQELEKVQNYIVHSYVSKGSYASPESATGVYGSAVDPAVDIGINASMLVNRKFKDYGEAVDKGYFPTHTNAVNLAVGGLANTLGVIARLKAISGLLDKGLAVESTVDHPETKGWPALRMSSVGLPDEMFGPALHNIRIQPDAMRVLDYGFRPELLARSEFGRYMSLSSGMLNATQLFGLNDYVNGMAAVSGFSSLLGPEFKASAKDAKLIKNLTTGAKVVGGGLAMGALASAGMGPAVVLAGGVGAAITAAAAIRIIRGLKPMTSGMLQAITEGKRTMNLIQSERALHPERLSTADRNLIGFFQAGNIKLTESKTQIERMRTMTAELRRQGKWGQATAYGAANLLNKPQQVEEIGVGGVGGKLVAKIGMLAMFAPHVMAPYQDANGNVDFSNKELLHKIFELSDDMDSQVGAIQYRNLHMNPAIVSSAKLMFRAFGFRYTTERLKVLFAADVMNNLAYIGGRVAPSIGTSYMALRAAATGGGTVRPTTVNGKVLSVNGVKQGLAWGWRAGSVALVNTLLTLSLAARVEAMMSHVLWPGSHYTQSRFAVEAAKQFGMYVGSDKAGKAFEGLLSVVPPEDSSLYEAMRHIVYETVLAAPQAGENDPNTGRPRRMIFPGAMYSRNLIEHPLALSLNPEDQIKAFAQWAGSGTSPTVSALVDIARQKDSLGRPLGFGDPVRNIKQIEAMNKWFETQPNDTWQLGVKVPARSLAHLASSIPPLFVRSIDNMAKGRERMLATSQLLGGRTMPPESSLNEAERLAFSKAMGKFSGDRDQASVTSGRLLATAKSELATSGNTNTLDQLRATGEITDTQYKSTLHAYVDKRGEPRPPVVRFLRKLGKPNSKAWKEVYLLSTPEQRSQIKEYLSDPRGSGYTKEYKAIISEALDWMAAQDKKR